MTIFRQQISLVRDFDALTLFMGFPPTTKYGMSHSLSRLLSDAMNIYSVLVTFRVSLFALSHMRIFS